MMAGGIFVIGLSTVSSSGMGSLDPGHVRDPCLEGGHTE